jgi:hypothetical protein
MPFELQLLGHIFLSDMQPSIVSISPRGHFLPIAVTRCGIVDVDIDIDGVGEVDNSIGFTVDDNLIGAKFKLNGLWQGVLS